MGLFGRKETGPRIVCCPNCGGSQEVSPSAQSVVCRHCNVTIRVTDEKIAQYSATFALETCGSVTIDKKGALVVQKRIVASNLVVKGSLKGNAIIYDSAHITAGAQVSGDLKARLLKVDDGATLKGFVQVVPADGCVTVNPPAQAGVKLKS